MKISVWRDETSDALAKASPTAGFCWKLSNLCGLLALVTIIGVILFLPAVLSPVIISVFYGSPLTISSALAMLGQNSAEPLPSLAIRLFLLNSICIQLYGISLAIVAAVYKDYAWAAGSVLFWPIAAIYSIVKGKEIRQGVMPKR